MATPVENLWEYQGKKIIEIVRDRYGMTIKTANGKVHKLDSAAFDNIAFYNVNDFLNIDLIWQRGQMTVIHL